MAVRSTVGMKEILGVTVEVCADLTGRWWIHERGDDDDHRGRTLGHGPSLDSATQKARAELNKRKIEVAVPFITKGGEAGVARKRHAGHGRIIADIGDFDFNARVFKPDTPQNTLAHYATLVARERDARREIREIEATWEMRLGTVLDQAIDEAAGVTPNRERARLGR